MDSSSASATNSQTDTDLLLDFPVTIQRYFDALNGGKFEQAAALFADGGQMVPPFEQPIEGREAIAHYLSTEAKDMTATPVECEPASSTEGQPPEETGETVTEAELQFFLVRGKVKTPLLGVNVAWQFNLSTANEIVKVRIKLLATLQELIKFNR